MIVFVDYEHAEGHRSEWGEMLLAARTRITYRLEDISGQHCMLVRYDRITQELLDNIDAKAIFLSGNGTDPARYDQASLNPLTKILVDGKLPVFGFCGGFQLMCQSMGADLVSINSDVPPEHGHLLKPFSSGNLGEMGYHPVQIVADHPLLEGVGADPVFRHAHHLEVPEPPAGFDVLASSAVTRVQMAVNNDRLAVGTQFHPEYYTDEFPAGEQMIRNFMTWAGVLEDR